LLFDFGTILLFFILLYIYIVGTYWLFVGIVFVAFIFLYITLPETKGLKLEEVQRLFERGSCMCGRTYDDDIRKDEELVVSAVGDTTKL
jgi:SP family myo-inositol transporter-like MFS transporter 13